MIKKTKHQRLAGTTIPTEGSKLYAQCTRSGSRSRSRRKLTALDPIRPHGRRNADAPARDRPSHHWHRLTSGRNHRSTTRSAERTSPNIRDAHTVQNA